MNASLLRAAGRDGWNSGLPIWSLPLLGLAAMYGPVYWSAGQSIWQTDDHAHGPLILALAVWLFWARRRELLNLAAGNGNFSGWALLAAGLLLFVLGRAFDSSVAVFASQPLVVAGVLLLLKGPAGLRVVWFAVVYLSFMVPLPSLIVDSATGPLKHWISIATESLLHATGYPIARSGVIITIGQYQMLVADACAGLHSMFSLAALGTLFMYLMRRPGRLHNSLMLAAILPIAVAANIVRVVLLVLITYHFGEQAGQGYLHGTAGIVLMVAALIALFLVDALLVGALRNRP